MASRFCTLRDLDPSYEGTAESSRKIMKIPPMTIHHLPTLSDADACQRMLQRIHREFYPIMERRGYRVLALSEMCCCGDGLDFAISADQEENVAPNPFHVKHNKKRKRTTNKQLRTMGLNVLGYNRTQSNGTHDIHLRLRHARNHSLLLPYEDVAGTMAHELAHCVHGPHNAAFYKLMDELLEQHAVFMARGIVADNQGFPMEGSDQAYTLGGAGGKANGAAAMAAQARRERSKWMPQGPQKLGGDSQFRNWLVPGQAAGMAAEMRRLQDDQWCQPCSSMDVIELVSSDEEASDDDEIDATTADVNDKKPAAVARGIEQGQAATSISAIDLTNDSSDENGSGIAASSTSESKPAASQRRKKSARIIRNRDSEEPIEWSCQHCTFVNLPLALACGACGIEARSVDQTLQVANEIARDDELQFFKRTEVERSETEFGFNIYGTTSEKTATRTMKHIT